MRSFLTLALALCSLGLCAQTAGQSGAIIGNKDARIYHLPTCKLVLKIKPESKVSFADRETAAQAGYAPCKICIK